MLSRAGFLARRRWGLRAWGKFQAGAGPGQGEGCAVTGERARQAGTLIGAVAVTALAAGVMAGGGGVAQAGTRHGTQPAVAGVISTEAGGPGGPAAGTAVAVTPRSVVYNGGNLYIADRLGNAVREVNTGTGALTTPDGTGDVGPLGLGGPATQASLSPSSVTLDASGNQVITAGNRVLVTAASTGTFYGQAMTAGDVYNVAGTGAQGYGGNGGAATSATLDYPYGVAVDAHGNLVIADTGNSQIRVVAARNGRFYGIGMTAGKIYHVAGNAKAGYLGDGGPASTAAQPAGKRGRGPLRQPGHRRHPERPDPGGRRDHRHLLRHRHDRRRHLPGRRERQPRSLGRRRPGHRRRGQRPRRRDRGRLGQPGHRRRREQR